MSLTLRRLYSTKPTTAAQTIASTFLSTLQARAPRLCFRSQLLDINQLAQLRASLLHHSLSRLALHLPVPPCYHLVYFTPSEREDALGADGSDVGLIKPPRPFTRRMWAGGELEWVRENKLRVGQMVQEKTEVKSVEAKASSSGEDMLVVGVEKQFENSEGLALVERRNWIFKHEIDPQNRPPLPPLPPPASFTDARHWRDITNTSISLFRFSALTFNAHKIHYDRDWCREVEGHRDCVVHGPLNLIHMVDLWSSVMAVRFADRADVDVDVNVDWDKGVLLPKKVTYRAMSPFYVGDKYRILMGEEREKVTEMKVVNGSGKVGMMGSIERW
ncbi:C6 transcription factor [Sclerotinia borealis F-4128]|uniref:C6 transcription factor n=1 Tax=Sclerotinia borealis (strain F-4128) TaxID=1432307 RepID=W9CLU9_SCLBF|nr:C6 transcription factor [Sclerotinia borealis F-4128]